MTSKLHFAEKNLKQACVLGLNNTASSLLHLKVDIWHMRRCLLDSHPSALELKQNAERLRSSMGDARASIVRDLIEVPQPVEIDGVVMIRINRNKGSVLSSLFDPSHTWNNYFSRLNFEPFGSQPLMVPLHTLLHFDDRYTLQGYRKRVKALVNALDLNMKSLEAELYPHLFNPMLNQQR